MPEHGAGGLEGLGRIILVVGLAVVALGLTLMLMGRYGLALRPLPGDIVIRRPGVVIYFPLVTMLVLSIILTLVMRFIAYLRH